jgi:hypothetical protein
MSLLGKIFCPTLGMDAASVGDEAEDHGMGTPGSVKHKCDNISTLYEILSFFIIFL